MMATLIEVIGLVAAALGGGLTLVRTRGPRRLLGLLPPLVYAAGQALPYALGDADAFPRLYPWALGVMAVAAALGVAALWRLPAAFQDGD